jgi:UDP-GlcNAc:undecaprenyl-phosphate/decaprenyl-phosphate GlcNAc-1-phosphate transferase
LNIPILPILIASITTFVAIILLRPVAIKVDLVDNPNIRKPHTGSVPIIGGIAMYIGVVVSIVATSNNLFQFGYFFIATSIIVIVGLLDDYRHIQVSIRLFFQVFVSLILVVLGNSILASFGNLFGNEEVILNKSAYLFSVLALMVGMNAINMSDGLHGLAGGTSLITFLAILYLSLDSALYGTLLVLFLLCSVLPVFLLNNMCIGISKNKRIFMGDAGSMVIGLIIAWLLIELSQGQGRAFSPVTSLWLFALPLIEMFTVVIRRVVAGKSPFKADLSHAHHTLIRLGFGEKSTLFVLLLFSLAMAIAGILGELYELDEWIMFVGFLLVFLLHVLIYGFFLKIK